MKTITNLLVRASLCLAMLLLSGHATVGELEPVEWVPYTTIKHFEMEGNSGFSNRIFLYLRDHKKLRGSELKKEFGRWNATNLGHVFEEASLASYGILKNNRMFNGRIPDGVENGKLEQIVQYTDYPTSTFIEVKYRKAIPLYDHQYGRQIIDMIDYLSANNNHTTRRRFVDSELTRTPRKASEEGLAVMLFLTPANTIISTDLIQYANQKRVKVYQMTMECIWADQTKVRLTNLKALTSPSIHFHGHFTPFVIQVPWDRKVIDPDTGQDIFTY